VTPPRTWEWASTDSVSVSLQRASPPAIRPRRFSTSIAGIEVNGSGDSSTDHELRAGTPLRFRIVGISDSQAGKTRFGLVFLELPKDSDSESKN